MNYTTAVIYKEALAKYVVYERGRNDFEAELLQYHGLPMNKPPHKLQFSKEGRHCVGNTIEQDLMDDLYEAVRIMKRGGGVH